ncbi:hypothetical protein HYPSUDRAFT_203886 [Hypholoma sublateritium FD-334 SS-4]|uniref:Uncharacterized protein n=1 Tax=Hypholoma sublateritium (strain FD-334 SS-4) TaxID=945553 RepID=A0A0D2MAK6_HYPSF|nr:hypothetical protein HYPSUDRAFT_203886 [Hypholoma sublateritium FD-334 SS-4]
MQQPTGHMTKEAIAVTSARIPHRSSLAGWTVLSSALVPQNAALRYERKRTYLHRPEQRAPPLVPRLRGRADAGTESPAPGADGRNGDSDARPGTAKAPRAPSIIGCNRAAISRSWGANLVPPACARAPAPRSPAHRRWWSKAHSRACAPVRAADGQHTISAAAIALHPDSICPCMHALKFARAGARGPMTPGSGARIAAQPHPRIPPPK